MTTAANHAGLRTGCAPGRLVARPDSRPPALAKRLHAAIVLPAYIEHMLAGRKTVEARLASSRRVPFGRVSEGDAIYFRATGSVAFTARAVVVRVAMFEDLTPRLVSALRREHNQAIVGSPAFWLAKRHARFATLIWLADVRFAGRTPPLPEPGRSAWAIA